MTSAQDAAKPCSRWSDGVCKSKRRHAGAQRGGPGRGSELGGGEKRHAEPGMEERHPKKRGLHSQFGGR